jgi:hypothetical protein
MRCGLARYALITTLAAAACVTPTPPPVAVRQPSLEAEDLAVVKALFDDYFRPRVAAPRYLVVGTTMAMCRRDPAELGPSPGRCLNPFHVNRLAEVVPPAMVPTVRQRFPVWNALPLAIAGPLGDDITFVSTTLLDMVAPSELLRRHPGSDIVWLTAPGYPAPGIAVITFDEVRGSGAARMERGKDGRWRVAASVWHPQEG